MQERQYRILYTTVDGQEKLQDLLERYLPKERGEAFLPRAELWMRSTKSLMEKTLFPGYVFVYTDLTLLELHGLVKGRMRDASITVRELGYLRREDGIEISDVTQEEAGFLDVMRGYGGILRMSYGYVEGDSYVVMEGPLIGWKEHIKKIDRHDRRAFLDIEVKGHRVEAGLELKPKRLYFPDDPDAPEVLSDGTEADLRDIAKKMMRG